MPEVEQGARDGRPPAGVEDGALGRGLELSGRPLGGGERDGMAGWGLSASGGVCESVRGGRCMGA